MRAACCPGARARPESALHHPSHSRPLPSLLPPSPPLPLQYVSGFISSFERRYSKLERVIKHTVSRTLLASPAARKKAAAQKAAQKAAAAAAGAEKKQLGVAKAAPGQAARKHRHAAVA